MKDICEQWTQNLILRMSAILDRLCINEEEQIILDKTETDLDLDLKMTLNYSFQSLQHVTYHQISLLLSKSTGNTGPSSSV